MALAAVNRDFLESLRVATESVWRDHLPRDFIGAGVGGLDWRTGTLWRGGLTAAEIEAAESRFGLAFPPDYRLFLATLHTPDPPMVGAHWKLFPPALGDVLTATEGREFPDWTGDPTPIEASIAWPLEGLMWSIEHDESWHPGWGPRPRGKRQRETLVREIAAAGPQLVPIFGHRYLVGPGDRVGNPVLSIYGSDVIVYGSNLRSYWPRELGVERSFPTSAAETRPIEPVPFWQDVIDGLPWYFA